MNVVRALAAAGLGLAAVLASGIAPAAAAQNGPTRLALAMPLTVPVTESGLLGADILTGYTREGGLLDRQLDAVENRPIALGIDPMIIASIRLLGTSAPPSATSWLQRLQAVTNDTFALGWADTDLTLATQAGGPVPVPTGFQFAVDPALFAPAGSTPTPAPTAAPDSTAAPTDAQLLDWPYTLDAVAWPRDDTLVAGDVAGLTASGFGSAIASAANVARESTAAAAEVDGLALAVADAEISSALRTVAATPGADLAPLTAAIAATGDDGPVLATLDRGPPAGIQRLGEVLDALVADPAVSLVPFREVLEGQRTTATIVDIPQSGTRVDSTRAMLAADASIQRFSAVAEDPAAIVDEQRLLMLATLSSAWATNERGWQGSAAAVLAADQEVLAAVQLATGSTLNFVADQRSVLPIPVTNALDQPVTVYVTVQPTTPRLAVLEQGDAVTIPANSQASA